MAQDEHITGRARSYTESEIESNPNDMPPSKQMRKEKSSDEKEENENSNEKFTYEILFQRNETQTLNHPTQVPKGRYLFVGNDGKIGLFDSQIEMKENEELQDFDVMDDKKLILRECTALKGLMDMDARGYEHFTDNAFQFRFRQDPNGDVIIGNDTNKQLGFELAFICSTAEEIEVSGGKIIALQATRPTYWVGAQFTDPSFKLSYASPIALLCFQGSLLADWSAVVGNDEFAAIKSRPSCFEVSMNDILRKF